MSAPQDEESTVHPMEQGADPQPSESGASTSPALDALTEAELHAAHVRDSLDAEMREVKQGVLRMGLT